MPRQPRDPAVRFWELVEQTSTCWVWRGFFSEKGYGLFWLDGKNVRAHRWAYESLVGPIPEGLTIDHLCRNRACVNPAHLEPVTNRENILRGNAMAAIHARQTHCIHGHEFTPENTYTRHGHRRGRMCRACTRAQSRASRELVGSQAQKALTGQQ